MDKEMKNEIIQEYERRSRMEVLMNDSWCQSWKTHWVPCKMNGNKPSSHCKISEYNGKRSYKPSQEIKEVSKGPRFWMAKYFSTETLKTGRHACKTSEWK